MSQTYFYRDAYHTQYLVTPYSIIRDRSLSMESKLLLQWLATNDDGFSVNTNSLSTIHGVGKNKITSLSKELQNAGHLHIVKKPTGETEWHSSFNRIERQDWPEHIEKMRLEKEKIEREKAELKQATEKAKPNPQNRDEVKNQQLADESSCTKNEPNPQKPDMAEPDMANRDALRSNKGLRSNNSLKKKKEKTASSSKKSAAQSRSKYTPMTEDWRPSIETMNELAWIGITSSFVADNFAEFQSFWIDSGRTKMNWNEVLKADMERKMTYMQKQQARNQSQSTKDRTVTEQITDRSWAGPVVKSETTVVVAA